MEQEMVLRNFFLSKIKKKITSGVIFDATY